MAHRLFHSLIFSSVVLLEGVGCSLSHAGGVPPDRDADPGGDGGPAPDDAAPAARDGGWLDAGGRVRDAGAFRDAWLAQARDGGGGEADGGMAAADAGARADGGDVRLCEEGWPPTKGFWCVLQDDMLLCCRATERVADGGTDGCCLRPAGEM